jgi:NAD dependent epimerase/dehydratase
LRSDDNEAQNGHELNRGCGNWKGKRVLVTGAGGFIGSHLTEALIQAGCHTVAFVHYRSSGSCGWLDHSRLRKECQLIAGDVRDADGMRKAMKRIDVVFHLAALIGIPYSYEAPESYVQTNVQGTLNVLQAARKWETSLVVHTSTSEVYGTARYIPVDEAHPLQGQSPYAATKIAADKLAEAFHLSFGLPVLTVRPFNTFGPRQSARAVIPTIIAQCLTRRSVQLGSLHPTRDLNFVGNTVEGFMAAAMSTAAIGRTINLGSGQEISIGDLAHRIAKLIGRDIEVNKKSHRIRPENSEVQRLLACNILAKELTRWTPRVPLEEGLRRTITWVRRNLNMYRVDTYAK